MSHRVNSYYCHPTYPEFRFRLNAKGVNAFLVYKSIVEEEYPVFKELLGHIQDINEGFTAGKTLLHYAAEIGRAFHVVKLLEQGADPFQPDNFGVTPFQLAREHLLLQAQIRLFFYRYVGQHAIAWNSVATEIQVPPDNRLLGG